MLEKIGINLVLEVVEPAVFFKTIRAGSFQLYASSWAGVADASLLMRTLKTGQFDNRVGYANAAMDRLLTAAMSEADEKLRRTYVIDAQRHLMHDLPYLPLWYLSNTAIVRKGLTGSTQTNFSLRNLEPLPISGKSQVKRLLCKQVPAPGPAPLGETEAHHAVRVCVYATALP